ncbi:MAG: primosomal protein N' [Clostridia bacterium]|nr:primosomal protein N' [Clostridia bacterium]
MIAEVIVDIAHSEVDRVFEYIALENTIKGQRVLVPFGNRQIEGYVLNLKETSDYDVNKLKTIVKAVDDFSILTEEFLSLSDYMIKHNHIKTVDAIRLFIPSDMRKGKVKELIVNKLVVSENINKENLLACVRKNAVKQIELINHIESGKEYLQSELNLKFGNSAVLKLIEQGVLIKKQEQKLRKPDSQQKSDVLNILTKEQNAVVESIKEKPATYLLFGVTGSGKTEVYMHCIRNVLKDGKTAIMLVPEISLTPQVLGSFRARFGEDVAILHSGLSAGERFDEWQRIRQGQAKIVVGARSAIFAPLNNVGIIIIDEEHDGSYKSESNPRFQTHDVAEFRAKYNNCPLVLGSATPSVESFYKAKTGEYVLLELPKRVNNQDMPQIQVVDMRSEISSGNTGIFSRQMINDMEECIKHNNQAMLFVNRRGFSSFVICRECGYNAKCEDCDASLVFHKEDRELKCHFCGRRYRALTNCPNCGSGYLRMGAIGTQRVVEELNNLFPNVKVLRMDFDTTQNKNAHAKILEEFQKTRPCILVGTQMIAKGHDFPNVTLVGIVDADMSLHFADYRSVERTFQLITQVAGRAGRADKIGKVDLQTYCPNHYVYRFVANYDYKAFFDREINLRQTTEFPPFATIMRVMISSEFEQMAKSVASAINLEIDDLKKSYLRDIIFCKAMKSPVAKIQKKHRLQIVLRVKQAVVDEFIDKVFDIASKYQNPKVSVFVEINPSSMS